MLLGEYDHAIDEKGRFTVPAKFRNRLASGMVITKGIDRCLWLYPLDGWEELSSKIRALPITNTKARDFRRQVLGGASFSEPDKQGRIILPPRLREYANIDNQAVIIGLDDHCEIWNPETWREKEAQSDRNPEERAEQFAELGI
jgi:MraZ protein